MGLFTRHADDGYVSPFDVGESPAYIDPAAVIERQSRADEKTRKRQEKARRDRKRDEHRRQERIEQAYYHGARPSGAHPAPAAVSRTTSAASSRTTSAASSRATPAGAPATPNRDGARTAPAAKDGTKRSSSKGGLIAFLVICAIAIAITIVSNTMDSSDDSSYSSHDDTSQTADVDDAEPEPQTFERTGTIDDEYSNDRMTLTITGGYAGVHDYDDARTVVIEVEAVNDGPTAVSMRSLAMLDVYQNGVGLQETYLHPDDDTDAMAGYDASSSSNDIQSGGTAAVTVAFALRDDAPLDVRITDHSGMTTIRSGFIVGEDTAGTAFEQIDSSDLPAPPEPTDTDGMTSIRDWDDSVIAEVRIDDIVMGPRDYDGQETVIVTYSWINRSDECQSLAYFVGDITAYLDGGAELEDAYIDSVDGYEDGSEYVPVLPGVQSRVTVAYALPRESGTVDAGIEDYDGTMLVERSFRF